MEEKEKNHHDIQTVFSVKNEGLVESLRRNDPSVIAVITPSETVRARKPTVTESIQVYLAYEVGEVESGTADKFKQLLVDRVYRILKGYGWAGYKVISVNVSIPDVPTDKNVHP